jgi:hypothetical protein
MNERQPSVRNFAATSLRDLATHYLALIDISLRVQCEGQTVVTSQALERLAVSEAISRYVRDRRYVDVLASLNAGANWRDIADVLNAPEDRLRGDFCGWVRSQRELYDASQADNAGSPPIGLSPAHGDAVLRLAASAGELERGHGRE